MLVMFKQRNNNTNRGYEGLLHCTSESGYAGASAIRGDTNGTVVMTLPLVPSHTTVTTVASVITGAVQQALTIRKEVTMSKAWRTAIKRRTLSRPTRILIDKDLITGRTLDYGCGRGDDADRLGCERYDPHFSPDMPGGLFDTIVCNYVLNVIEIADLRMSVLWDIQDRLAEGGRAYISVRADRKKLNGETSIGTWQGLVTTSLPEVYSGSDCVIYELRAGNNCINTWAETF